jgi:hypothetical protein
MGEVSPVQAVLLPHSHGDREWYEPFASFRLKLVAMMDLVLDLLDEQGQLAHFHLDGQTVMVEDYLDLRPEKRPVVEDHIRSGRLSFGPFYTLADEFLVSGEGIIRNLEKGLGQAEALGLTLPVGGLWAGQFLDVAGAHISAIRRRGDALEVRVWNDSVTPRTVSVSGMAVELGPAEIRTIGVESRRSESPSLGHTSAM